MRRPSLTLGARYIFPVEGPPIADGRLTIEDGRIAWIGPARDRGADLDLGNVAIIPGFVNAHTHLELSALGGGPPAPRRPRTIVAWLRRVVDQRREGTDETLRDGGRAQPGGEPGGRDDAAGRHDHRRPELGPGGRGPRARGRLRRADRPAAAPRPADQRGGLGLDRLDRPRGRGRPAGARPGLSPHAPYSTAGWLYYKAAASRLPLSTHLAEMPEELELLERRGGRLRQFLEDLGAWDDEWEPIGPRPADYVRRGELRQADWLIAHGTYIDPSEFWQLRPEAAPDGQRVAVAYCPRTHARFGHAPHPYRALLERGVVVCLGTDSLASSPTLSILDEIRFLHRARPLAGRPLAAHDGHPLRRLGLAGRDGRPAA